MKYADTPPGGTLAVFGLGPVGQFCARIGRHLGADRVIGLDLVPERLEMARRHGIEVLDVDRARRRARRADRPGRRARPGRGDRRGRHGGARRRRCGKLAQTAAGLLPDKLAQTMTDKAGVDRLVVLHAALKAVRRGGTVSISGVYGGEVDPMPLMEMFDRGIQLRMGQCHVRAGSTRSCRCWPATTTRWAWRTCAPTGCRWPSAPQAYEMFQKKEDGCVKVVLAP